MTKTPVYDVVVVDDEIEMARVLAELLESEGWRAEALDSAAKALERVREGRARVVLSDLNMPGMNGMELLAAIGKLGSGTPLILLTAFGTLEGAMEAVRAGAYHYLTKPVNAADVVLWIRRALGDVAMRAELAELRENQTSSLDDLRSHNPRMQALFHQVPRLASLQGTVLITGESGTGKERIARALHQRSHRSEKPFVPVNCSAIPENLLESELFGHEEGAFTGAMRQHKGLFEIAGEGTLFLDEIGDLPLSMQAKLLRVLQDGQLRRVGATQHIQVKARIVAATNRDLREAARSGRFREDLYYRLNVIPVELPPLRDRREDIVPLAQRYLDGHCHRAGFPTKRLSRPAQAMLESYPWPGNIRELANAMERVVAFTESVVLEPRDFLFLQPFAGPVEGLLQDASREWATLAELEDRYIEMVLQHTGGHKGRTCEILGIDPKTLYRRVQKARGGNGEEGEREEGSGIPPK